MNDLNYQDILRRELIELRAALRSHFRRYIPRSGEQAEIWSVPDLCAAYGWPKQQPGGGTIAIIELRGGWVASDMQVFFEKIGQPPPIITDVFVDDTPNAPSGRPDGPDAEVALDIQIAGASYYCATGSPATIRVYWTWDIAAGMRAATADGCDVCAISYGGAEIRWGRIVATDLEQAAIEAAQAGMIVFASAGDHDSSDGVDGPMNVQLPASAPHVISCGGTTKRRHSETVWNDEPGSPDGDGTGGGFSMFFPMPCWQIAAPHGPGRMVPDVAANADPDTGYEIIVHGEPVIGAGTSAVPPLYAGLFASFGPKLGFVAPELWSHQTCFHDITVGDNGAYRALPGPDPCSGLGVPIGSKLAALMGRSSATVAQRQARLLLYFAQVRAHITYGR